MKELSNRKVPFYEFFGNTIQGEGPRLRSAIFIRNALCNFRCEGFDCEAVSPQGEILKGCDTIRAVNPKFKEKWRYFSDFSEITKIVDPLLKYDNERISAKKDIVWTGGEPLLFWETKVMQDTLAYYLSRGHHITIETNASLDIDFFNEYQKKLMFSMSVKLSNSGEPKDKRININTISKILINCPNSYLKFVINPKTWDNDFKEIMEILDRISIYAEVYLMPIGETRQKQIENTPFVFEMCAKYGFNFSPRCHILAFDSKEGI